MQDFKTGVFSLAKNNTLAYELDDECAGWIALLQAVDGERSTAEILDTLGLGFDSVREFFMLSLKEEILRLGERVATPTGNAVPA
jgi:hypothetical protein